MLVSEIFLSIQGESTFAGLPCVFIRLAGCNLSCAWCDTPYARVVEGARELAPGEVVEEALSLSCRMAEITGGEPLLQGETARLASMLADGGMTVLMETNGSVSLEGLDERIIKIIDVKCPSSGQDGTFLMDNVSLIRPEDEVKFVIGDRNDYEFARRFMEECLMGRTDKVLFAPVRTSMEPGTLAGWILKDRLKVRLQLQLHSYIWEEERGR